MCLAVDGAEPRPVDDCRAIEELVSCQLAEPAHDNETEVSGEPRQQAHHRAIPRLAAFSCLPFALEDISAREQLWQHNHPSAEGRCPRYRLGSQIAVNRQIPEDRSYLAACDRYSAHSASFEVASADSSS